MVESKRYLQIQTTTKNREKIEAEKRGHSRNDCFLIAGPNPKKKRASIF
jgi:hypothetical protein